MNTILVVEDEAPFLDVLRRVLERAGYAVLAAETPQQALALVANGQPRPDAAVIDVLLPGGDGISLHREIVKQAPWLGSRTVFLTGAAHDRTIHDAIEALGVPLIGKLDDLSVVVDAVRVVLLQK